MSETIKGETIFEPGDIVTCAFFGDEEFTLKESLTSIYPLRIQEKGICQIFTEDGKYNTNHTHPVLKLVRKAKKKVKKKIEGYMNVYPECKHDLSIIYLHKEDAIQAASKHAIAIAVPVSGEYEVYE